MNLDTFFFIVFTVLIFLGTGRTIVRYFEYKAAGHDIPILLVRDLISRTGLAWPFVLVLLVRVLGAGPLVAGQLWWILLTSVPAIISAAIYAYFEFFVIDKTDEAFSLRRNSQLEVTEPEEVS